MSMSDLKGIDGAGGGPIDSIRPEDRVREGQTLVFFPGMCGWTMIS